MSEKGSLGLSLGDLPTETVDAIFAGLSWEAETRHGLAMRAAVVATFAAARVEAEVMNSPETSTRDRLKAADQFKSGFIDLCKMVHTEAKAPLRIVGGGTAKIPEALEKMYGED